MKAARWPHSHIVAGPISCSVQNEVNNGQSLAVRRFLLYEVLLDELGHSQMVISDQNHAESRLEIVFHDKD